MKRSTGFGVLGVMMALLLFFYGCGPSNGPPTPPTGGNTTDTYTYVGEWGSEGADGGQFKYPARLTIDGSDAYVIDWGDVNTSPPNISIQKLSAADGSFQSWIGSFGKEDGQFTFPNDVKVRAGMVYVVDSGGARILKFNEAAEYQGWLGKAEDGVIGWHIPGTKQHWEHTGDGEFSLPQAMDFDSAGNMYVADTKNHRIQKFDPDGNFLGWWGRDSSGGNGWHDPRLYMTGEDGSGNGEFNQPRDLAVGPGDYIYVSDSFNSRVQKFTSDGTYVKQWDGSGLLEDRKFGYTSALCVDSEGCVYVLEGAVFWSIIKFDPDGGLLAVWDKSDKILEPMDIDVDAAGRFYLLDGGDCRVKIFSAD